MAQQGYALNHYGNKLLGDISHVSFKIVASTVQASQLDPNSSPDVSVLTSAAGAYTVQLPKGVYAVVDGITPVNAAAKTIGTITFNYSTSVVGFTLSGGANAAGAEEIHAVIKICAP